MNKIGVLLQTIEEKQAKLQSLGGVPAAARKNLDEWYRVELTYTSNAIEGNTLSRAETALVVEKGVTVAGKSIREHLEATNHAQAWEWIQKRVLEKQVPNERPLLDLHYIILQKIDDMDAGKYRNTAVRIAGSRVVLPNPLRVPELMGEFWQWLVGTNKVEVTASIEAHYRLVTIHPFADGNGRTARLLMNWLLLLAGYPPIVVRKEERGAYLSSLEKAQLGGSRDNFDELMLAALSRSLDGELEMAGAKNEDGQEKTLLKIGSFARQVGETVSTIRHWTRMGLIPVAGHTKGGYQLYDQAQIVRTMKIRELQEKKRLNLEEIRRELD